LNPIQVRYQTALRPDSEFVTNMLINSCQDRMGALQGNFKVILIYLLICMYN